MQSQFSCNQVMGIGSISTHKTLWPDPQEERLLTHGTFKNTGSKPVRGKFHVCVTLTSEEALGTQIEPTTIPLLWIPMVQRNSRSA